MLIIQYNLLKQIWKTNSVDWIGFTFLGNPIQWAELDLLFLEIQFSRLNWFYLLVKSNSVGWIGFYLYWNSIQPIELDFNIFKICMALIQPRFLSEATPNIKSFLAIASLVPSANLKHFHLALWKSLLNSDLFCATGVFRTASMARSQEIKQYPFSWAKYNIVIVSYKYQILNLELQSSQVGSNQSHWAPNKPTTSPTSGSYDHKLLIKILNTESANFFSADIEVLQAVQKCPSDGFIHHLQIDTDFGQSVLGVIAPGIHSIESLSLQHMDVSIDQAPHLWILQGYLGGASDE